MDKIQIAVEVTTDDYETAVQVSERLTQDRINQELREAGLDEGLLVKKAQVALSLEADSGGRGSTTLLTVLLVAAISCSIIAGAILGYCWRRRKMQELAGMHDGFDLVKGSPTKHLESKGSGAELQDGTSARYGAGDGSAGAAKVAGRSSAGADDGKVDAKAAGGSPGDGWGTKEASESIMVDEDGSDSAHTHAHHANTHMQLFKQQGSCLAGRSAHIHAETAIWQGHAAPRISGSDALLTVELLDRFEEVVLKDATRDTPHDEDEQSSYVPSVRGRRRRFKGQNGVCAHSVYAPSCVCAVCAHKRRNPRNRLHTRGELSSDELGSCAAADSGEVRVSKKRRIWQQTCVERRGG